MTEKLPDFDIVRLVNGYSDPERDILQTARASRPWYTKKVCTRCNHSAACCDRQGKGRWRLAVKHSDRIIDLVPLAVTKLKDPARRVRWRAAYELRAWAGDVPLGDVEEALKNETHPRGSREMERLLQRVKQQ